MHNEDQRGEQPTPAQRMGGPIIAVPVARETADTPSEQDECAHCSSERCLSIACGSHRQAEQGGCSHDGDH